MIYLAKTPDLLSKIFTSVTWHFSRTEPNVYFTFDDGPHPEVTPQVLNILQQYNCKATFFCLGKNVQKYPELYLQVQQQGHTTGNHTCNHLNGWKTSNTKYFLDILNCRKIVDSNLFRPPYGKIKPSQVTAISKDYRIILYDLLSCDFDAKVSVQQIKKTMEKSLLPGSIIVFHDSIKCKDKMLEVLPWALDLAKQKQLSPVAITA